MKTLINPYNSSFIFFEHIFFVIDAPFFYDRIETPTRRLITKNLTIISPTTHKKHLNTYNNFHEDIYVPLARALYDGSYSILNPLTLLHGLSLDFKGFDEAVNALTQLSGNNKKAHNFAMELCEILSDVGLGGFCKDVMRILDKYDAIF